MRALYRFMQSWMWPAWKDTRIDRSGRHPRQSNYRFHMRQKSDPWKDSATSLLLGYRKKIFINTIWIDAGVAMIHSLGQVSSFAHNCRSYHCLLASGWKKPLFWRFYIFSDSTTQSECELFSYILVIRYYQNNTGMRIEDEGWAQKYLLHSLPFDLVLADLGTFPRRGSGDMPQVITRSTNHQCELLELCSISKCSCG